MSGQVAGQANGANNVKSIRTEPPSRCRITQHDASSHLASESTGPRARKQNESMSPEISASPRTTQMARGWVGQLLTGTD
jgi:hypothetical protein